MEETSKIKKKMPLHTKVLLGMVAGIVAGIIVRQLDLDEKTLKIITQIVKPVGDIFLRFIFMMVVPLILSALTLGVADLGDMGKVGRLGLRMLKYTFVVTSISVILGIGLVHIVQPGKSLSITDREALMSQFREKSAEIGANAAAGKERTVGEIITSIVPKNPLEDMVRAFDPSYTGGGMLAVMFFALIIGIAMTMADPMKIQGFKSFLEGLYDIVMRIINMGMKLAPYGVASLLFILTINMGLSILGVLLKYVLLVLFALAFHLFVTYSVILKVFTKMSPLYFFKNVRELMITAFSTSSSNASLPIALKVGIEKLKLPKDIASFVLTIGSTGNQNGTALYEGITILFLAQCFGVELSLFNQVIVVLISVMAGMGTAGVPGGSLPVLMLILISIGIPGESIALIYGVDRILDMSRTVLNVTGDMTAAVYIAHTEKQLPGHVEESAE